MKRRALGVVLAWTMISTGCVLDTDASGGRLRGDGVAATAVFDAAGVRRVVAAAFLDVEVVVGAGEERVVIACDENLLAFLDVELVGDRLRVHAEPNITLEPTLPCEAAVTVEDLVALDLRGAGDVRAHGESLTQFTEASLAGAGRLRLEQRVGGDRIDLRLSGAGDLEVAEIDATTLVARVGGAGDLEVLAGAVERLALRLPGAGAIDTSLLDALDAEATLSGLGDIRLTALESARASVPGAGTVTVFGNPPTQVAEVSGLGGVRFETDEP